MNLVNLTSVQEKKLDILNGSCGEHSRDPWGMASPCELYVKRICKHYSPLQSISESPGMCLFDAEAVTSSLKLEA